MNADELFYWLLQDVTFSLACDFELGHRVAGQDFRRLLWAKQLDLCRGLSPDRERRRSIEIKAGRKLKRIPPLYNI